MELDADGAGCSSGLTCVLHRMLTLERGVAQKEDADVAKYVLKHVSAIDLDNMDRKKLSVGEILAMSKTSLGPNQKSVLTGFLQRITDRNILGEMGLILRNGRVKMGFGSGTELISPQELSFIANLCDFELPEQS
ncbi:hypothetical protein HER20_31040 [Rhizobium sp. BUS002]|uniref:Uncharacterized protein n=1 Tax=Rhizobium phaseoli TaxID=396 RepID=A0A7X6J1Z3_9HYPH|nr:MULTISPECIES: hypothetical protein [Rhizobium]MDE8763640.1 hypothetical protein [Rhizobium sp. CBK13]NKF14872.1 hypothetical protein [Rhizobium phaseoli]QPK09181.1 hypothetical protein HER27_000940 [Rhizobium phaseoli]